MDHTRHNIWWNQNVISYDALMEKIGDNVDMSSLRILNQETSPDPLDLLIQAESRSIVTLRNNMRQKMARTAKKEETTPAEEIVKLNTVEMTEQLHNILVDKANQNVRAFINGGLWVAIMLYNPRTGDGSFDFAASSGYTPELDEVENAIKLVLSGQHEHRVWCRDWQDGPDEPGMKSVSAKQMDILLNNAESVVKAVHEMKYLASIGIEASVTKKEVYDNLAEFRKKNARTRQLASIGEQSLVKEKEEKKVEETLAELNDDLDRLFK